MVLAKMENKNEKKNENINEKLFPQRQYIKAWLALHKKYTLKHLFFNFSFCSLIIKNIKHKKHKKISIKQQQ